MLETEVIIAGSGVAALTTAYYLHEHKNVMIFTKAKKEDSNSWLAQGGVAASISREDDWRCHFDDTMAAGCQHNEEKAVELLVRELMKTGLLCNSVAEHRRWKNGGKENEPTQITTAIAAIFH
ncbi:FAD binding domain-containing protein [Parageobacillus thermantarcticus]|uniref:L-aspartate oxidase n=1 Tax=Parageobacillus thermantarcticus TaxID=186116 RepID=A0A1I0SGX4_9BACL|nr:FAD binding domain-containing protein [Parageobacillus thermantarcticus]